MDWQAFVDNIDAVTCVMSVEMKEDGHYGDICIVCGNEAYVKSIELAYDGPQLMSNKFVPGSRYQNYFPTDLNFETVCYRAAVEKTPVHTYVHPDRFDFWFDLYLLPLANEGNIYYCTYTQVVTAAADSAKMSNLSQETTSTVLNTCIKLNGAGDYKEKMKEVIKDIRGICGAHACTFILMNQQERKCSVLAEDRDDPRVEASVAHVLKGDNDFYDLVESWEDTLAGTNCLIIKNETDMEYIKQKNKKWSESLIEHGVTSLILFPIRYELELLGYMWATNFDVEKANEIKEIMQLTMYFVSSSVANFQLLRQLRIMGSVDMLTGVMNRNEMNERVNRIVSGEDNIHNLGIVFADINGLKRINDEQGHFAGDQLLKHAAEILRDVFRRCDVYRAGGDEFMIIIPDTNDEELEKFCQKVKSSDLKFGYACFATGWYWTDDSVEIRKAMHIADERMYKDKAKFYEEHPELKR